MNESKLEFQEIYDTFQLKILRYMARMVGDADAEDLTQDVFVKTHRALKDFKGEAKLSTWLYRIATNTALDKLRSPSFRRDAQASLPDDLDEARIANKAACIEEKKPLIEQQLVRKEMNECVQGYIEKLPESYRTVLVLSEFEGLGNNEIAEILGVSLNTVKIRLHRAKAKLKKELESHCEFYWIEEMPCSVK